MNNSMTSFVSAAALALAVALGSGAPARAELNVDITQGFVEPLPVAITDFYAETLEESKTGKDLAGGVSPRKTATEA